MKSGQWARLRAPEAGHLRRGAWYRVVRLSAAEVVLDVHGKPTPFPRDALEIQPEPPKQWAVVPRPSRSPRLPATWGAQYAVCPNCRERAPLDEHATSMRCPKCNGHFEIGWGHS
jgi:Zn finger protein HypA/HybF involved in hydrogenase expression